MEHVIDILWLAVLAESKHSVLLVSFYERNAKAVLEERTLLEGGRGSTAFLILEIIFHF